MKDQEIKKMENPLIPANSEVPSIQNEHPWRLFPDLPFTQDQYLEWRDQKYGHFEDRVRGVKQMMALRDF